MAISHCILLGDGIRLASRYADMKIKIKLLLTTPKDHTCTVYTKINSVSKNASSVFSSSLVFSPALSLVTLSDNSQMPTAARQHA